MKNPMTGRPMTAWQKKRIAELREIRRGATKDARSGNPAKRGPPAESSLSCPRTSSTPTSASDRRGSTPPKETPPMSGYRPALDVLAELRRGKAHAELTEALHEVLTACMATGKKGEVVLKLTINPKTVGDHETPRIEVTDQIGTKKPTKSVHPSTFFLTDDLNPVRRDPNQDAFDSLREVPSDTTSGAGESSVRKQA